MDNQENNQRKTNALAPIALFAFKRPAHTCRTLESLAQNPEFSNSHLFIYCDGARNDTEASQVEETRQLMRNWQHPNKTIIERDRNWGLANSIIEGVTELCERFGRVIVVEDDLIVSPVFLNYLNAALERYVDEPKVMQVSAHMFPVEIHSQTDAVMLPFTTSWGWATWDSAWKYFDPSMSGFEKLKADSAMRRKFNLDGAYPYFRMLKRQAKGQVDSWAIRWYSSVFFQNGYVVFPKHSLVQHEGYDETATHATRRDQPSVKALWGAQISRFPNVVCDEDAYIAVLKFFRTEKSLLKRLLGRIGFA
ncbi:sugar transferase [Methyloglobulus morosus KoM1]|uniref:Sugar transferase n=1 Tax=Methyloglobulus morosus KoM1 TaxID=1116472 RepID=V5C1Z6_9GAMM|nr:glycosyltransferase [Methyloglobulus morosus]ESS74099.1 sugar transferase [Methyloglobulus morosus KoM1]